MRFRHTAQVIGGAEMRGIAACAMLLLAATPAAAVDPTNLIATGRTDTTINVEWEGGGNEMFTVDYLGPDAFGNEDPTCAGTPQHDNILETSSTLVTIRDLDPSTLYQIHVHAIDPNTHQVIGNGTNFILVRTGDTSLFEPLTRSDYIDCSDGGGDDGCAHLTFELLPGSLPFAEVQVTFIDPSSGEVLFSDAEPIGVPLEVPAGRFRLQLGAPNGYVVTPVQRGLHLKCGDDEVVRLRFESAPPRRP